MSEVPAVTDQPSFWSRQIAPQSTAAQYRFDIAFGIVIPLICLFFDPIVFRSPTGRPLLGSYAFGAGTAICLGLLSLSAFILIRHCWAFLAGLLAGGEIFATVLGVCLLPFSLVGLLVLIGVLGLAPFATAFVFGRNAIRAYRKAGQGRTSARVKVLAACGLAVSCGGPWAAQWYVGHKTSEAVELILSPDPTAVARGIAILAPFGTLIDLDRLAFAYEAEADEGRRERLAAAFKQVTGEDIEERLSILND